MVNMTRDPSYIARGGGVRDAALREPMQPLVAMTTKELWAVVGAWAEAAHAEKVAYVRAEQDPARVRKLIIRLIELRWEEDVAGRGDIPLLALHETRIVTTMKHKGTGITMRVNGRLAPRPWVWTFAELANYERAATPDGDDGGFALLVEAKHHLDLEHVL